MKRAESASVVKSQQETYFILLTSKGYPVLEDEGGNYCVSTSSRSLMRREVARFSLQEAIEFLENLRAFSMEKFEGDLFPREVKISYEMHPVGKEFETARILHALKLVSPGAKKLILSGLNFPEPDNSLPDTGSKKVVRPKIFILSGLNSPEPDNSLPDTGSKKVVRPKISRPRISRKKTV
jgi:hypothetical protein